jgi:hypothetical protein
LSEKSTQTRVIAITRQDEPLQLDPRHDARLRAGDTAYLVGPYREVLDTLRMARLPQQPATDDHGGRGEDPVDTAD